MWKELGRGLLGRTAGYGVFALGFWLLYQGFERPQIPLVFLGGALILGSMYLMAKARRAAMPRHTMEPEEPHHKEDHPGDTIPGSDKGN